MASVEAATDCRDESCKLPKSVEEKSGYIENGRPFKLDNTEEVKLQGNYYIKMVENKAKEIPYEDENIRNQAVYSIGNVLIRKDTENILELIDLLIRYTHDPCKDVNLSLIKDEKQMRWGTICPTKKTLFTYKSKVFVAYGRYIYGYDKLYVTFQRDVEKMNRPTGDKEVCESEDEDESEEDDEFDDDYDSEEFECEKEVEDEITADKIILNAPKYDRNLNDYVYSFCIYDVDTQVIDAFGLYR